MTTYTLTPCPWQTFMYANGTPVANGQVFTYAAGTTTPAPTFLDVIGTPNTNPILLDAAGRAVIYLAAGSSYRFDLYDSVATGGMLIKTQDNISAVPNIAPQPMDSGTAGAALVASQCVYLSDGEGSLTAGRWYPAQANSGYSASNPVVGFAAANASAGATVSIIRSGQVTGLVGLIVGAAYFIDPTTAGAITTAATMLWPRYVGQADSATTLMIGGPPFPIPNIGGFYNNTGPINDFVHGTAAPFSQFRMTNASLTTISGFTPGYDGQLLIVRADNAQVDLLHQSTLSQPGNRLQNLVTSGPTSLIQGGYAEYIYDQALAYWRLLSHVQGAALSVAFSAANFQGSGGAGTWVPVSGSTTVLYYLTGRMLRVGFSISASTVTTSSNVALQILKGAYGGYTAKTSAPWAELLARGVDAVTAVTVQAGILLGQPDRISLEINPPGGPDWTSPSSTTTAIGGLTFEVL